VVAGIRTPSHIEDMARELPEAYRQFVEIAARLEKHYRDMQDMEFTIERGKLWMLQTRSGKRTARAAIKIAVDMVAEGLISKEEALMRVSPDQVDQLLHPNFDPEAKKSAESRGDRLAKGLAASPGAAVGMAVFDAKKAEELGKNKTPVILVRPETSPEDVAGMNVSKGILTQHGGMTSHAAVVARGWGIPCVAGAEAIRVDESKKQFSVDSRVIREGDHISIDGTTGEVFAGQIKTVAPRYQEEKELIALLGWADQVRRLGTWTNADRPEDARAAREFGAQGIGLCRTEHMFFQEGRIPIVQRMILESLTAAPIERRLGDLRRRVESNPNDENARHELEKLEQEANQNPSVQAYRKAIADLLPLQRSDFEGIFEVMDGLPVIIRLIDPPLHEFLPSRLELTREVTQLECNNGSQQELEEKKMLLEAVSALAEVNPMLGLRGCRLGILYPGVTEMQVQAIFEAAINVARRGIKVHPEVMIPLVMHVNELKVEQTKLEKVAKEVMEREGMNLPYKFGTMIEVPRAALTADQIAELAQFFSFGTNDLTQMGLGISRDDAQGKFLGQYLDRKILPEDPFQTLDKDGVGKLMRMAVEGGRATKPNLEIGICGEVGGDPATIEFCHQIGLNYVSASPYRVPVARLAAAQAALRDKKAE